ncbi:MAG: Flp family type IVb pilin [Bacillota bacterium]
MLKLWKRLVREDEGQGLVEYALIIGLIAVVLVIALQNVEGGIAGVFDRIKSALDNAPVGGGT